MRRTSLTVPFFDLSRQCAEIRSETLGAIEGVLDDQAFVLGPGVARFEAALGEHLGGVHAVGCNSGTDALLLSLLALGIGPGDEVITTPFSFLATATVIPRAGAKPVFVDLAPGTFHMNPDALQAAITPRTKAILPVHLFGSACDIESIVLIADHCSIPVVEDVAQALGTKVRNRPTGTFGRLGCFSFYPTKNLGAFGDAGAIVTSDARLESRLRTLRVHGQTGRYHSDAPGMNSRLDSIQAAVLLAKLPHLARWNEARRRHAAFYRAALAEIPFLSLPEETSDIYATYHQFVVRAEARNALAEHLNRRGIGHAVYYPEPLHLQPALAASGLRPGSMPEAEKACREVLALPIFPELRESEREEVVLAIREFSAKRS